MLDHEIEDCFHSVVEIAKDVGKIIKDAFYKDKTVLTKSGMADLVTETDQLVEKKIISALSQKFPKHSFIGEESIAAGAKCELTDNPTWVIDPIDGTTNFVHRFPYIAVSIGFLVNKETVIGLVYNPILDELYTAKKGQGAFCNGRKLQVTTTEELGNALLCAEFGSSRDKAILDSKFRSMRSVIDRSHGARELGSMACALCQVAKGDVDAFFHDGFSLWDIAAGYFIILEAGGVVHDVDGGPLDLMSRRMLCAGTEKLAQEIAKYMEKVEYDRD